MKKYRLYAAMFLMSVAMTGCSKSANLPNTDKTDAGIEATVKEDESGLSESAPEESKKEADSDATADLNDNIDRITDEIRESTDDHGILSSTSDINLTDVDGNGTDYTFTYDKESYKAQYKTDNWKIFDSYRINSMSDMAIICQALIDVHPIHGSDMKSYREPSDMVYEWIQHNVAYMALPDDSPLKSHAKDVDFDPADQNKNFDEIYKDRTGKELDINDILTEEEQEKLIEGLKEILTEEEQEKLQKGLEGMLTEEEKNKLREGLNDILKSGN